MKYKIPASIFVTIANSQQQYVQNSVLSVIQVRQKLLSRDRNSFKSLRKQTISVWTVIFIRTIVSRNSNTPLPNYIKIGQKYNNRSETSFMPLSKVLFALH